jgi:hypothetical protein
MYLYTCKICHTQKECNFKSLAPITCGKTECVVAHRRQTNLEKYGHINSLHGKEGKAKVQKTLQTKYGQNIKNVSQIPEIKKQKQKTCFQNHGCPWPMQNKDIREKSKQTCLKTYGVDNVSKSPVIIQKLIQIQNEIGLDGLKLWERSRLKTILSNEIKYGVKYYFQTKEFKEKYVQKMLEQYNVENYFQSEEFHQEMISQGLRYSENDLTLRKEYYREVHKLTNRTIKKYNDFLFNNVYLLDNIDYHIDHIYSISQGFKNNIQPEIISSIINLQILPKSVNMKKQDECWITKEQLLENYQIFLDKQLNMV